MNPETRQKWVEWLGKYRPLGLLVVFKDDELLLKSWGSHTAIDIYGKVTYTLYRPELKGVWSEVSGQEAHVTITWSEDDQSPVYGIDKAEIIVYPTRMNPEVEDGTVIIDFYRDGVMFRLKWVDFTDIIAFTTNAITDIYPLNWVYPDEYEEPTFAIDVYDEKIPTWHDDLINKIMSEPHDYLSPKLEQQLEEQRRMRRQRS
jgi:hypothetical protein